MKVWPRTLASGRMQVGAATGFAARQDQGGFAGPKLLDRHRLRGVSSLTPSRMKG